MSTPKSEFSLDNSANAGDRSANFGDRSANAANQQTAAKKKGRVTVVDVAREIEQFANVKHGHRNELLQMLSGKKSPSPFTFPRLWCIMNA